MQRRYIKGYLETIPEIQSRKYKVQVRKSENMSRIIPGPVARLSSFQTTNLWSSRKKYHWIIAIARRDFRLVFTPRMRCGGASLLTKVLTLISSFEPLPRDSHCSPTTVAPDFRRSCQSCSVVPGSYCSIFRIWYLPYNNIRPSGRPALACGRWAEGWSVQTTMLLVSTSWNWNDGTMPS